MGDCYGMAATLVDVTKMGLTGVLSSTAAAAELG